MHIDILGIVEETIHLKSWKIPWVLFWKQEGGKLQRQHLWGKRWFLQFFPRFSFFLAWLPTYGVHFFLHAHFILNLVPLCTQFSLRATTLLSMGNLAQWTKITKNVLFQFLRKISTKIHFENIWTFAPKIELLRKWDFFEIISTTVLWR